MDTSSFMEKKWAQGSGVGVGVGRGVGVGLGVGAGLGVAAGVDGTAGGAPSVDCEMQPPQASNPASIRHRSIFRIG